jgi:hypothetical protein
MEEFISLGNKAANLKASIMKVAAAKCLKMGASGVFYSGREIITFCIECCEEMFHSENLVSTLINEKTGQRMETGSYDSQLDIEIETALRQFRNTIVKAENLLAKVSK